MSSPRRSRACSTRREGQRAAGWGGCRLPETAGSASGTFANFPVAQAQRRWEGAGPAAAAAGAPGRASEAGSVEPGALEADRRRRPRAYGPRCGLRGAGCGVRAAGCGLRAAGRGLAAPQRRLPPGALRTMLGRPNSYAQGVGRPRAHVTPRGRGCGHRRAGGEEPRGAPGWGGAVPRARATQGRGRGGRWKAGAGGRRGGGGRKHTTPVDARGPRLRAGPEPSARTLHRGTVSARSHALRTGTGSGSAGRPEAAERLSPRGPDRPTAAATRWRGLG